MERLHRLCRNVSMGKSATAVSLQPAGSGNQETEPKGSIIIGLEVVLESVSKGQINDPKVGQDNHIRNFRVGCNTMRGAARTRSRRQNTVSQHGSSGSVPYGGPRCCDCSGTVSGSAVHFPRRHSYGPRKAWL